MDIGSVCSIRGGSDYARSAGMRNKTDALDAGIIADFVRAHRERLPLWHSPTAELRRLQELVRRRHQVDGLLLGERNRLEGAACATVRSSIQRVIKILNAEKATLEKSHGGAGRFPSRVVAQLSTALHHQRHRVSHRHRDLSGNGYPGAGRADAPSGRAGWPLAAPRRKWHIGPAQQRRPICARPSTCPP